MFGQRKSSEGWVYVMANASMPQVYKVGKTQNTPQQRARELSKATGVPTDFVVIHARRSPDCHHAERMAHRKLRRYRVNRRREFFKADKHYIARVVDDCCGAKRMGFSEVMLACVIVGALLGLVGFLVD